MNRMLINIDFIYPIGSIYISERPTNPELLFGGKWEETCKSRYLMGSGSNAANNYEIDTYGSLAMNTYNLPAGKRIGETKHTLTTLEMPKHNHTVSYWINSNLPGGYDRFLAYGNSSSATPYKTKLESWMESEGGSDSHNNMPPGETYYIWKRVG